MSDSPSFSIIIPTYNYAHYLSTAINSVLHQNRDDCQIIVVDDASTDNTPEIVSAYGDSIEYVRFSENMGPATAWSVGIERAKGEYLCKLDADDWQLPGFMDAIDAGFCRYPAAGIAITSVYTYSDGEQSALEERVSKSDQVIPAQVFRQRLLGEFFMRVPGVSVRRECLQSGVGPMPELFIGHDWEYFIRMLAGWDCLLIAEPYAVYRVHQSSVTCSAKSGNRIYQNFGNWLREAGSDTSPYRMPSNERARLSLAMAKTLLRIVGLPTFEALRHGNTYRHFLAAFQLAASEKLTGALALMGFLTRRFAALTRRRLFPKHAARIAERKPRVASSKLMPDQTDLASGTPPDERKAKLSPRATVRHAFSDDP